MDWRILLMQAMVVFAGIGAAGVLLRVLWNRLFDMPGSGWPEMTTGTAMGWFVLVGVAASLNDALDNIVDAIGKIP